MSLFKWQFFSFISRVLALVLGIIQSFVIVNVLTPNDWGIVKVVASIASFIGVTQSLGITGASTREISGAKDLTQASKIFTTALIIRNVISLPFAIALFLLAPQLSNNRGVQASEVSWALQIMAITLILQTSQGVFNSVLSAFQKFKTVFVYQVFVAIVSICLYIPLVYFMQFKGYYIAYLVFNLLSLLILFTLTLKNLKLSLISFSEFVSISKAIFSISVTVYVTKLLYTLWLEGPVLYLDRVENDFVAIPIFSFALLYSTKLLVFSDSITDVTLPVMSKKFVENINQFKAAYKKNYIKTFIIITFAASFAAFWNGEIIKLFIKEEYYNSIAVIPLTLLAVFSYSNIDLLKSSIFVPAKKLKNLVVVYFSAPVFHYLLYFYFLNLLVPSFFAFALAFGVGTFLSLLLAYLLVKQSLDINLLDKNSLLYFLLSVFYVSLFYSNLDIYIKLFFTIIYIIVTYYFCLNVGLIDIFIKNFRKK